MTSEPSTSTYTLNTEQTCTLQKTSPQGQITLIPKQNPPPAITKSPLKIDLSEEITSHQLMPIVKLLLQKCESAVLQFDRSAFDMQDVKNLFKLLEEQGVQLSSNKNDVDSLMEAGILALRMCLVELERVYVLTDCFKAKYLSVLRKTVCHEALVGNNGDSDDELTVTENPLNPNVGMQDAFQVQTKAMESALTTLQAVSGTFSIPLNITQQAMSLIPSASQMERNLEFLRQCGIVPPKLPQHFGAAGLPIHFPFNFSLPITVPKLTVPSNNSPEKTKEEEFFKNLKPPE